MLLNKLEITNFRNIQSASLAPTASFNLFYGVNGSGKTSLLEAIYYLFMVKSFRSQLAKHIVNYKADNFLIFGQLYDDDGTVVPVGLEKLHAGSARIRMAGKDGVSKIELAKQFPLQLLNTHGYRLLEDGPKYRRHFLDWGLFHVEQSFIGYWQRMMKLIRQRNAALKSRIRREVIIWDEELIKCAESVHRMRVKYLAALTPLVVNAMRELLGEFELSIEYYPGWNPGLSLSEGLEKTLVHDLMSGNTSVGPHRADIHLTASNMPIKDLLSRGQQKMVLFAMRLAQGELHRKATGRSSAYLIDDFPSELDAVRRERVAILLKRMQAQSFITAINKQDLELFQSDDSKVFHVEQGRCQVLT